MKKLYLFFAVLLCAIFSTQTAQSNIIYVDNNDGWSSVYCYMWNSSGNNTWPGAKMVNVGNNLWAISAGSYTSFIINVGSNTDQSGDLTVSSTPKLYQNSNFSTASSNYQWKIVINGTTTTMTYNSSTNKYTANVTLTGSGTLRLVDSLNWYHFYGASSLSDNGSVSSSYTSSTTATSSHSLSAGTHTITWDPLNKKISDSYTPPVVTEKSRELTKIALLQGGTEVASDTGSPYEFSNVSVTNGGTYQIAATYTVTYSDGTTPTETKKYTLPTGTTHPTLGTAVALSETTSNGTFTFAESGNVNATVTVVDDVPTSVTFTGVAPDNCYVIGHLVENGNAWGYNLGVSLTESSEGIFTGTITTEIANASFGITTKLGDSWTTTNANRYGPTANDTPVTVGADTKMYKTNGGDNSWQIASAGAYTITVNFNNNTFKIEETEVVVTGKALTKIALLKDGVAVAEAVAPYEFSNVDVVSGSNYEFEATYTTTYSTGATTTQTLAYSLADVFAFDTVIGLYASDHQSSFQFPSNTNVDIVIALTPDGDPYTATFTENVTVTTEITNIWLSDGVDRIAFTKGASAWTLSDTDVTVGADASYSIIAEYTTSYSNGTSSEVVEKTYGTSSAAIASGTAYDLAEDSNKFYFDFTSAKVDAELVVTDNVPTTVTFTEKVYEASRVLTSLVLHKSGGDDTPFTKVSDTSWTLDETVIDAGKSNSYYLIATYDVTSSDGSTAEETVNYILPLSGTSTTAGAVSGISYALKEREGSTYFYFDYSDYLTTTAVVTVTDGKASMVTFTEVESEHIITPEYPKVALVNQNGGNVVAYFTQDATNRWLWKLGPQTITKADNNNTSSKYRFRVYTSETEYVDYSTASDPNNANYWFNSGGSVFDVATGSGNICINFGETSKYFAVTMLNGVLMQAIISDTDESSELKKPMEPVELDTKAWKVTASSEEPAVFLIGDYLNNKRVTPEYQMTKNAEGVYELKNFVMPKGTSFRVRVFTGTTTYTDYASTADGDYWGINTWKNDVMTFSGQAGSKNFRWNLGQSMIASLTFDYSTKAFTLDVDEEVPSMDSNAPIKGVPFVSLIGEKFTQGEDFDVQNSSRSTRDPSTDKGWQEGWVQYDADGNVILFDSGVTESAYGTGAVAGRAMYNTIWPPRNTTSFMNSDFVFSSDDITFKYDRTENTTLKLANGSEVTGNFAVYVINYVWMDGRYKIWTGWGGLVDYDLYSTSTANYAEWRTHYNYGSGAWSEDNSDVIVPDTFYGLNRSENVQNDAGAGGNFNFNDRYYFSKVEFWYNIDNNGGSNKSAFIGYLANGEPMVDIARTGKQEVTGTYSINHTQFDDEGENLTERKVTDWNVSLYRIADNDTIFIDSKGESGVAKYADEISGEFVVGGLEAGIYYYTMTVTYAAGGNAVEPETLTTESNKVRIFGVVMPSNVSVKQITETGANDETLYSFDLEISGGAPKELLNVNDDLGNPVLNLVEYYIITVPKHANTLFTSVEGATEMTEPYGSQIAYNFAKNHYFKVTPDKANNYALPTITLRNVIPGSYSIGVDMIAPDGDEEEWAIYQVTSATAKVAMVVPETYFTASKFAITSVNETAELVDGHAPMGIRENQPMKYHKSNKLSTTDGKFVQLPVTNSVLNNWAMTYTVKLTDLNDAAATYTYTLADINGKALNAAGGVDAQFDYLPIPYEEASAEFATGNTTIDAMKSRQVSDGNLSTTTTIAYKRVVSGYETDVVATTKEYSAECSFVPTQVKNGDALVAYDDVAKHFSYQIEESYDWVNDKTDSYSNAFASLTWTPNATLHNAAGYYAASTFSNGNLSGYTVIENGGYATKAFPAEGGEVTYGTGYSEQYKLDGYEPGNEANNFAEAAAVAGKLPVKIWYVGDGDGTPNSWLNVVLTADYPVLVNPTLAATLTDAAAVSTMSLADGVFEAEGVTEKMITLSYPELLTQDLSGTTTDVINIAVDGATDFRIYPNPVVDVVNVAASTELGTIEIYSVDGRLVKVVEVDDTRAAVEVGDLVKGSYIIRAAGATQRMIKK